MSDTDRPEAAEPEVLVETPITPAVEEPPPPLPEEPPPPPKKAPKAKKETGKWLVMLDGKPVGDPQPTKMHALRAGAAYNDKGTVTVEPELA